jgi:phenylacetic acid degradation operon negative regulatory protein
VSDHPDDEAVLPRSQIGPNPQHLLVTLLGDYWHARSVSIPSGALVDLLAEFGISAASSRSALSRLAKRGIIELRRDGRRTAYAVRDDFLESAEARATRILRFGAGTNAVAKSWDGEFTLVAFSLPNEQRRERELLRSYLRGKAFAPIHDGLWAAVGIDLESLRKELSSLELSGVSVFSASLLFPDGANARRELVDWPLERLGEGYAALVSEFAPFVPRAEAGDLTAAEAFVVRTRLMDSWRSLVRLDPDLPDALLPPQWPRDEARRIFRTLYDTLGALAALRCSQIVLRHDPELLAAPNHLTARDV